MAYKSVNPFNNKVLCNFNYISNTELDEKLNKSKSAFTKWQDTSFEYRANLLSKLANLLSKQSYELGRLISLEMGKPITQSVSEVEKCALVCNYYANNAATFLDDRKMQSTAQMSKVCYSPLGTIFAVMPWNFPFWQAFRFLAPALMAGNVALLKHASNVPQCAQAIEQVLLDAGIPEGVFQNLFVNYNQVEQVIASPIVKAVTFTGSNFAGSKIAMLAGKYTKKSVLELGGSDPFVVFNDAELNGAVENGFLSRFLNAGQVCIAAKRFILHEDIASEFIEKLKTLLQDAQIGNPLNEDTFIGPMVNEQTILEIEKQIQDSINLGAVIECGGKRFSENKNVFLPTIVTNVKADCPIWKDEVFGPVAAVVTFKTDEEALQLANDTQFGLGASVWTHDKNKAMWLAKNINAGTVVINGMVKSELGLPFGGINESGYGRELADYGMYEFVNIKTIAQY